MEVFIPTSKETLYQADPSINDEYIDTNNNRALVTGDTLRDIRTHYNAQRHLPEDERTVMAPDQHQKYLSECYDTARSTLPKLPSKAVEINLCLKRVQGENIAFKKDQFKSVGLGYALAIATKLAEYHHQFRHSSDDEYQAYKGSFPPVYATGVIFPTNNTVTKIDKLDNKVASVLRHVEQSQEQNTDLKTSDRPRFYFIVPYTNRDDLIKGGAQSHLASDIEAKGGKVLYVKSVADALEQLHGDTLVVSYSTASLFTHQGLQPITYENQHLFVGRDAKLKLLLLEAIDAFENQQVLRVMGDTGTGKSSMVDAGLRPLLYRASSAESFIRKTMVSGSETQRKEAMVSTGQSIKALSLTCDNTVHLKPRNYSSIGELLHAMLGPFPENKNNRDLDVIAPKLGTGELEQNLKVEESKPSNRSTKHYENALSQPELLADLIIKSTDSSTPNSLIVLDQLEEVISLQQFDPKLVQRYLTFIVLLARSPLFCIIAIFRNDYSSELNLLEGSTFAKLAPDPNERQLIIEQQAQIRNIVFQGVPDNLATRIKNDSHGLPLSAIAYLFQQMHRYLTKNDKDSNYFTYEAYESIGGAQGVMAKQAESAMSEAITEIKQHEREENSEANTAGYEALSESFFEAFIGVDEDHKPVARALPKAHINHYPEGLKTVISSFMDKGLISECGKGDTPKLKLSHDSLLSIDTNHPHWPAMAQWFVDKQDLLSWVYKVGTSYQQWLETKQLETSNTATLLSDASLEAIEKIGINSMNNSQMREYVHISQQANLEKIKQESKRNRRYLAITTVLTILAIAAGFLAMIQAKDAEQQRKIAVQAKEVAEVAREKADKERNEALTSQSRFLMQQAEKENKKGNYDTALLLALNAMPGLYGGERPEPMNKNPLLTASEENNIKLVIPGANNIRKAKLSANGEFLLAQYESGLVQLWSIDEGEIIFKKEMDSYNSSLTINATGTVIAYADYGSLYFIDLIKGQTTRKRRLSGDIKTLIFSPDGHKLAYLGRPFSAGKYNLRVWSKNHHPESGSDRWTRSYFSFPLKGSVDTIKFSLDGSKIFTTGHKADRIVWDAYKRQKFINLKEGNHDLNRLGSFSSDGKLFVTFEQADSLNLKLIAKFWSTTTGRLVKSMELSTKMIRQASLTANGSLLQLLSTKGEVEIWSIGDKKIVKRLKHEGAVSAFLYDGNSKLSTVSKQGDYKIWAFENEVILSSGQAGSIDIENAAPSGESLVLVSRQDNFLKIIRIRPRLEIRGIESLYPEGPDNYTLPINQIIEIGKNVIIAINENYIFRMNINSGKLHWAIPNEHPIGDFKVSYNGLWLIQKGRKEPLLSSSSSEEDEKLSIWSIKSGRKEIDIPVQYVASISDGKELLVSRLLEHPFDDQRIPGWLRGSFSSKNSKKLTVRTLRLTHQGAIVQSEHKIFPYASNLILTNSGNNMIVNYGGRVDQYHNFTKDKSLTKSLVTSENHHQLRLSPDENRLAAMSQEHDKSNLSLIDANTGDNILELKQDKLFDKLIFTPSGNELILVGNKDKGSSNIRAISTHSGNLIWELNLPSESPYTKHDFSKTGNYIIFEYDNQYISLVHVESGKHIGPLLGSEYMFSSEDRNLLLKTGPKKLVFLDIDTSFEAKTINTPGPVNSFSFINLDKSIVIGASNYMMILPAPHPKKTNPVDSALNSLSENRSCLSPEERSKYYLPELTDEQWRKRGCDIFTRVNRLTSGLTKKQAAHRLKGLLKTASNDLEIAREYADLSLQLKDYKSAIPIYASLHNKNPFDSNISDKYAFALEKSGKYGLAAKVLQPLYQSKDYNHELAKRYALSLYKGQSYSDAARVFLRNYEFLKELGEPFSEWEWSLRMYGLSTLETGQIQESGTLLESVLSDFTNIKDKWHFGQLTHVASRIASKQGNHETAAAYYESYFRMAGFFSHDTSLSEVTQAQLTGSSDHFLGWSWHRLHTGHFSDVIKTIGKVMQPLDKQSTAPSALTTNLAHAHLLNDNYSEAVKIYKRYKGKKVGRRVWDEIILDDFKALAQAGIDSAQFDKIALEVFSVVLADYENPKEN